MDTGGLRDIEDIVAEDGDEPDPAPAEPEDADDPDATDDASAEADDAAAGDDTDEAVGSDTPIDITIVPDEITEPYVEAVLTELERVLADALVTLMEDEVLSIEVTDRLSEVFAESQRDVRYREFGDLAEVGFPGLLPRSEIVPRSRTVVAIRDASATCVWVETEVDSSTFLVSPPPSGLEFLRLAPRGEPAGAEHNGSQWLIEELVIAVEDGDDERLRQERPCAA